MFKFLKEKLKTWTKSFSEKETAEADSDIEKSKKESTREKYNKIPSKKDSNKKTSSLKSNKQKKEIPEISENEDIIGVESEVEKSKEESKTKDESNFFSKIKKSLTTHEITQEEFDSQFEELETALLENNVALEVVDKIKKYLEEDLVGERINSRDLEQEIKNSLKDTIKAILLPPFDLIEIVKEKSKQASKKKPFVVVLFGINGSGKTTTIAKLVKLFEKNKISSVIAAADTFRAASIEQLEKHGEKLKVKVIKHDYKSDPAAVGFDAIKYAESNNIDAVLIDTAGRMYTESNLMKEMEKIVRVVKPDLKIFIGESTTGNDATTQAKEFSNSVGLDAIILSKADIDERGGTILSVGYVSKKPIIYLGTGQNYDDLEPFNRDKFIESLGL